MTVWVLKEYLIKELETIITVFENKEECKKAWEALMEYYEAQWFEEPTWEWDDFYIPDRVEVTASECAIKSADRFIRRLK